MTHLQKGNYLTPAEYAKREGVSVVAIYKRISRTSKIKKVDKDLEAVILGGSWYIKV